MMRSNGMKQAIVRQCRSTEMEIELAYETFGNPKDRALVLIMGLGATMIGFDEDTFIAGLVEQGPFFVVRFDNRDVGRSSKVEGRPQLNVAQLILPKMFSFGKQPAYQLQDFADDAIALLDHLNIKSAHFLGVSMGGMICQVAALTHPDRVRSMTLCMTSSGGSDLPGSPLWVKREMAKTPKSTSFEHVTSHRYDMVYKILATGPAKPDEDYVKKRCERSFHHATYAKGTIRQAAAITRAPPREEQLRDLHTPTLIIHGEHDVLLPAQHGYRLAALLPNSTLKIYPDMGHYLVPSLFLEYVKEVVDLANRADDQASA